MVALIWAHSTPELLNKNLLHMKRSAPRSHLALSIKIYKLNFKVRNISNVQESNKTNARSMADLKWVSILPYFLQISFTLPSALPLGSNPWYGNVADHISVK